MSFESLPDDHSVRSIWSPALNELDPRGLPILAGPSSKNEGYPQIRKSLITLLTEVLLTVDDQLFEINERWLPESTPSSLAGWSLCGENSADTYIQGWASN